MNHLIKVFITSVIIVACITATLYFHFFVKTDEVFSHVFYIPIIISSVWWKRSGIIISVFLSIFLIVSQLLSEINLEPGDIIRSIMFVIVAITITSLMDNIRKNNSKIIEQNKELELAKYEKEKTEEIKSHNEELTRINKELNTAKEIVEENELRLKIKNEEYETTNEELRQTNEELCVSKLKAEESERLKSVFLANMSHEIRTPMNGILGFADLLKSSDLSGDKQKEYIEMIQKSGKRMLNIINDIVNISKIESGLMQITKSNTSINELLVESYSFFKPEAERKGITLSVESNLHLKDIIIKTDKDKVFAVISNLINNAIKFTQNGTIEIGCTKKEKQLLFHVKDTGSGIGKDKIEIIFERFRQGNELISRGYEGTGLGLSISKAFIEMLGGNIWVESKEGEGSTFYFTLPYEEIIVENEIDESFISKVFTDNPARPFKVLIAEDDETSEQLIKIRISMFCNTLLVARNGKDAVNICRENPDIDIVFMDIKMPEMNGYDATKQIREFNKKVIIIAQTAFSLIRDRQRAIEAGCNEYLSKPFTDNDFYNILDKYFFKQERFN